MPEETTSVAQTPVNDIPEEAPPRALLIGATRELSFLRRYPRRLRLGGARRDRRNSHPPGALDRQWLCTIICRRQHLGHIRKDLGDRVSPFRWRSFVAECVMRKSSTSLMMRCRRFRARRSSLCRVREDLRGRVGPVPMVVLCC